MAGNSSEDFCGPIHGSGAPARPASDTRDLLSGPQASRELDAELEPGSVWPGEGEADDVVPNRSSSELGRLWSDEVQEQGLLLADLVRLHRGVCVSWDWAALAVSAPPEPPVGERDSREEGPPSSLRRSTTGLWSRLLAWARRPWGESGRGSRQELELSLRESLLVEQRERELALWKSRSATWRSMRDLGERVAARDEAAFQEALDLAGAFEAVVAYGSWVEYREAQEQTVLLEIGVELDDILPGLVFQSVPDFGYLLREWSEGARYSLLREHLCSLALRVVRDAFAVLPIAQVVVQVGPRRGFELEWSETNGPSSGYCGASIDKVLLSICVERGQLKTLHFDSQDSVSLVSQCAHRMNFDQERGLLPVEPILLSQLPRNQGEHHLG